MFCLGMSAFVPLNKQAFADDSHTMSPSTPSTPSTPAPAGAMNPTQRAQSAPKGTLKNPYNPNQAGIVGEGHELFQSYSCSGCHGGTGGGGMCPPVNGEVWFYGLEDDTLFRLITLGSVEIQKQGFARLGGTGLEMPPFGALIKTDDDVWKILTWIRSVYKGDPAKKFW
jgi:mono/diheme cytochrome c family protein